MCKLSNNCLTLLLTKTIVWYIVNLQKEVIVMVNVIKEYKGVIIFYLLILLILFGMGMRSQQIDSQLKYQLNTCVSF